MPLFWKSSVEYDRTISFPPVVWLVCVFFFLTNIKRLLFFFFLLIEHSKPKFDIKSESKTVEAQDRSPITLTVGDNVTALSNTSIAIQCPTSGVPTPSVTWTKDGQEMPKGGKYKVEDDGSLVIIEADEGDNGQYTCTADSVAGKDSKSSAVQIVGKSMDAFRLTP